jgi:pimeloyl-ACP methyl ester carboxylesterase
MATYVLVHGGGHGGWCYQPVARMLRAQGHEVYAPSLTGLADREHLMSADIDLNTHITDVAKLLQYEDLRDVILVGHSYGGMVITGVADRATDRIANVVYLDAAYPMNGQSLVDVAGEVILAARDTARVIDGIELVLFPGKDPMGFFGVTDPAQIAWMKPKLTPHPWKCFDTKLVLNNEEEMRKIPQSFILSSVQIDLINDEMRAGLMALCEGRLWEIVTGHDLMISEPEATADALHQISQR